MADNRLVLVVLVVSAFLLFNNLGSYSGAASITRGYETSGFGKITPEQGYSAKYASNIRKEAANGAFEKCLKTFWYCKERGSSTQVCLKSKQACERNALPTV